jgi:hypothetical protein
MRDPQDSSGGATSAAAPAGRGGSAGASPSIENEHPEPCTRASLAVGLLRRIPDRELWRKEFHECWPLVAAVAGVFLVVGLVLLRLEAVTDSREEALPVGVSLHRSFQAPSGLERLALAMMGFSIVAGILLALRQFLVPALVGEWPFLLHRQVTRTRLLGVKVGIAALLLGGSMVVVWTVLLWVAGRWHVSPLPLPLAAGTWREGVLLLSWGAIAYLATADACVSNRPWYTTKCATPLVVAGGILLCFQLPTPANVLCLTLGLAVPCGLSLSAAFLTHEFEGGA